MPKRKFGGEPKTWMPSQLGDIRSASGSRLPRVCFGAQDYKVLVPSPDTLMPLYSARNRSELDFIADRAAVEAAEAAVREITDAIAEATELGEYEAHLPQDERSLASTELDEALEQAQQELEQARLDARNARPNVDSPQQLSTAEYESECLRRTSEIARRTQEYHGLFTRASVEVSLFLGLEHFTTHPSNFSQMAPTPSSPYVHSMFEAMLKVHNSITNSPNYKPHQPHGRVSMVYRMVPSATTDKPVGYVVSLVLSPPESLPAWDTPGGQDDMRVALGLGLVGAGHEPLSAPRPAKHGGLLDPLGLGPEHAKQRYENMSGDLFEYMQAVTGVEDGIDPSPEEMARLSSLDMANKLGMSLNNHVRYMDVKNGNAHEPKSCMVDPSEQQAKRKRGGGGGNSDEAKEDNGDDDEEEVTVHVPGSFAPPSDPLFPAHLVPPDRAEAAMTGCGNAPAALQQLCFSWPCMTTTPQMRNNALVAYLSPSRVLEDNPGLRDELLASPAAALCPALTRMAAEAAGGRMDGDLLSADNPVDASYLTFVSPPPYSAPGHMAVPGYMPPANVALRAGLDTEFYGPRQHMACVHDVYALTQQTTADVQTTLAMFERSEMAFGDAVQLNGNNPAAWEVQPKARATFAQHRSVARTAMTAVMSENDLGHTWNSLIKFICSSPLRPDFFTPELEGHLRTGHTVLETVYTEIAAYCHREGHSLTGLHVASYLLMYPSHVAISQHNFAAWVMMVGASQSGKSTLLGRVEEVLGPAPFCRISRMTEKAGVQKGSSNLDNGSLTVSDDGSVVQMLDPDSAHSGSMLSLIKTASSGGQHRTATAVTRENEAGQTEMFSNRYLSMRVYANNPRAGASTSKGSNVRAICDLPEEVRNRFLGVQLQRMGLGELTGDATQDRLLTSGSLASVTRPLYSLAMVIAAVWRAVCGYDNMHGNGRWFFRPLADTFARYAGQDDRRAGVLVTLALSSSRLRQAADLIYDPEDPMVRFDGDRVLEAMRYDSMTFRDAVSALTSLTFVLDPGMDYLLLRTLTLRMGNDVADSPTLSMQRLVASMESFRGQPRDLQAAFDAAQGAQGEFASEWKLMAVDLNRHLAPLDYYRDEAVLKMVPATMLFAGVEFAAVMEASEELKLKNTFLVGYRCMGVVQGPHFRCTRWVPSDEQEDGGGGGDQPMGRSRRSRRNAPKAHFTDPFPPQPVSMRMNPHAVRSSGVSSLARLMFGDSGMSSRASHQRDYEDVSTPVSGTRAATTDVLQRLTLALLHMDVSEGDRARDRACVDELKKRLGLSAFQLQVLDTYHAEFSKMVVVFNGRLYVHESVRRLVDRQFGLVHHALRRAVADTLHPWDVTNTSSLLPLGAGVTSRPTVFEAADFGMEGDETYKPWTTALRQAVTRRAPKADETYHAYLKRAEIAWTGVQNGARRSLRDAEEAKAALPRDATLEQRMVAEVELRKAKRYEESTREMRHPRSLEALHRHAVMMGEGESFRARFNPTNAEQHYKWAQVTQRLYFGQHTPDSEIEAFPISTATRLRQSTEEDAMAASREAAMDDDDDEGYALVEEGEDDDDDEEMDAVARG